MVGFVAGIVAEVVGGLRWWDCDAVAGFGAAFGVVVLYCCVVVVYVVVGVVEVVVEVVLVAWGGGCSFAVVVVVLVVGVGVSLVRSSITRMKQANHHLRFKHAKPKRHLSARTIHT